MIPLPPLRRSMTAETMLILALTLAAFALRIWQLDSVPPGWRDDELINSLVISQKVLDGDWQVYYADASGHEALYHALNAIMLGLFGANFVGIRLLSVFLGTLTVPLTWRLGRRLFGPGVGLLAAGGLAFSFWGLMYARIGLRHVLMPVTMLLAFIFFWRALAATNRQRRRRAFALAGVWIGLGFYVYFASRGVPLILLAFGGYLLLVARPLLWRHGRGLLLMFALAALLALPLFITLGRQPESEARVGELAVPLVEARAGNLAPLQDHVITTLSMFHNDGDDEWLYNIPGRPVFGLWEALFFWMGVTLAAFYALLPLWRLGQALLKRGRPGPALSAGEPALAAAFLLIWWLAGISPGFVSVPPASLGHTILAQPAAFVLLALPVWQIRRWARRREADGRGAARWAPVGLALLLLIAIAARDWPGYFGQWPARGMVRFLYRANIHDVADYVNKNPDLTDFAVAGLLAGPWDKVALQMGLDRDTAVSPRWFNPERALFLKPAWSFTGYPQVPHAYAGAFTAVDQAGAYQLAQAGQNLDLAGAACFQNGLCLVATTYDPQTGVLELGWQASRPLDLPPFQLISNPPPPGVDARPRLLVFAQLLAADGRFLGGDDGLWVDPYSLQPGDIFLQQHRLAPPADALPAVAAFGLYDPVTGARILTEDGRDHLSLPLGE